MLSLVCLARIQIPRTSAPMANPVMALRPRSIFVFLFHCSRSTCRMKCICSAERPSLAGSILFAKGASDSFGVLSAMFARERGRREGGRQDGFTTATRAAAFQTIRQVGGDSLKVITMLWDLRWAEVASNKRVQHPNESPRQRWLHWFQGRRWNSQQTSGLPRHLVENISLKLVGFRLVFSFLG